MQTLKDQIGNEILFEKPFQRIISLVPSQTELLVHLTEVDKIVGRTKFCIHPSEKVKKIPIVGGTKKFDFKKIEELAPDLIIANKEENYKEGIEALSEKYTVWTSNIFDIKDNCDMINCIGVLVGEELKAKQLVRKTLNALDKVKDSKSGKVLYFIWQDPYMVAGKNTFVDYMLNFLGYENLCIQMRYPEMDPYILEKMKPDYVLLSSEPYPFKEKHVPKFKALFPQTKILLVDGEMFSWYGSRLLEASKYFHSLKLLVSK